MRAEIRGSGARRWMYVRPGWAWAGSACLMLSALVRIWNYGETGVSGPGELVGHVLLPVAACTAFSAVVLTVGQRDLRWSLPALYLGVVFFIVRILDYPAQQAALCILLYLALAALYTVTVQGILPTAWPLGVLAFAPLPYHLLVEDFQVFSAEKQPMGREAWLLEISVLCIMAGLVCLALGMRRREAAAERFKNSPQNVQETFIKSGNIAPGPSVLEVSDKSDERRK